MNTVLSIGTPEWDQLTEAEHQELAEWVDRQVGSVGYVRAVELLEEGFIRVEMYADEDGEPTRDAEKIHVPAGTIDVATVWRGFVSSEPPPPAWPLGVD